MSEWDVSIAAFLASTFKIKTTNRLSCNFFWLVGKTPKIDGSKLHGALITGICDSAAYRQCVTCKKDASMLVARRR